MIVDVIPNLILNFPFKQLNQVGLAKVLSLSHHQSMPIIHGRVMPQDSQCQHTNGSKIINLLTAGKFK